MSSAPAQPTKSNLPEEPAPPKATLGQFIEDNSKLVTSIAAFIALTAFSSQLENNDLKPLFPALTFLAAALLSLELLTKLPAPPHHWRLEAFSRVFALLVMLMGWYWFLTFPGLWIPLLLNFVQIVLLFALAGLLTYLFTKAIKLVTAKLFKPEIGADVMRRVSQMAFLLCTALVFVGLLWISRKLANHPIRIHIPVASKNTDVK
ncbi:MAG TPA: hypothetical protein VHF01_00915 [Candidatus Acidoferrum sp.]|nr:hypothetical protein [Candidatus Acidoferrum sp.]